MTVTGFTQSTLSMRKMDGAPQGEDWFLSMADVLIYASIEDAIKDGRSQKKYVNNMALMLQERIKEWID